MIWAAVPRIYCSPQRMKADRSTVTWRYWSQHYRPRCRGGNEERCRFGAYRRDSRRPRHVSITDFVNLRMARGIDEEAGGRHELGIGHDCSGPPFSGRGHDAWRSSRASPAEGAWRAPAGPGHDRRGRYGQTSIPSPSAPDRISYTLQDELFAASPPRRDAPLRRTLVDQEICSISLRKEN